MQTAPVLNLAIEGDWKGIDYRMENARLSETYNDHNNKRRCRSVFRGFVLEINCPVDMPLVVFNRDMGGMLNRINLWAALKHLPPHKLDLEDEDLEAIFQVHTDDPARAAQTLDALLPEF
ncbi:MAG: hypothetical protein ACRBB0_13910 [Pelagimonas sp.]|uniref:hypothetical protein n=1 Tax=Pelagimonas sp. TaxID=2073170 RepID=UPI003D6B4685